MYIYKMIGIYKITSPSNKKYIGQSIDIKRRFSQYKKGLCKNQTKIYNSFLKYGVENHTFEIIDKCTIELLNERERYWQEYYNCVENGLNCKYTKTNDKSGNLSEETKEKQRGKRNLSKEQKNKYALNLKNQQAKDKYWFKKCTKGIVGRKKTIEERLKISLSNTGKVHSEKAKIKMSLSKKNMTEETKQKISLSSKGRKQSEETIKKRILKLKGLKSKTIINIKTGEEYKGLKTVSDLFGFKYNSLANMLNGHRKNNTVFKYK